MKYSKPVWIATGITFLVTLLIVNTIGFIAGAIFLGTRKEISTEELKGYFVVNAVWLVLIEYLQNYSELAGDPLRYLVTNAISGILMAGLAVGMAAGLRWVVRKVKN